MGGDEGWRANVDTHKMSPEQVEKVGAQLSKRPPGQHPGNILHQRGRLGLSKYGVLSLAVGGAFVVATLGWISLYVDKKPEKPASEVAKSTVGMSHSR